MLKKSRLVAYFFLIINAIVWGAALVITKPSFAVTTPMRFLLYRYLLACFFSIPFLIYYWGKIKKIGQKLVIITLIELLGTVLALILLYSGLNKTSALEANILTSSTPIFVVLAGIFLLKEKQQKHEWLGLIIAFLGTLLLTFEPIWRSKTGFANISLTGNLLIIAQNIITSVYFILAKKYYKNIPKLFAAIISFWVGLICFAFINLFLTGFSLPDLTNLIIQDWHSQSVILASVYMALFGSIIGYTAYIKGQENIEASEASLFAYLQPLIYIPLGILWLKEGISFVQILALIIIFFGVIFAEKRRKT